METNIVLLYALSAVPSPPSLIFGDCCYILDGTHHRTSKRVDCPDSEGCLAFLQILDQTLEKTKLIMRVIIPRFVKGRCGPRTERVVKLCKEALEMADNQRGWKDVVCHRPSSGCRTCE